MSGRGADLVGGFAVTQVVDARAERVSVVFAPKDRKDVAQAAAKLVARAAGWDEDEVRVLTWSDKAGCSCGCSPGFVARFPRKRWVWAEVA